MTSIAALLLAASAALAQPPDPAAPPLLEDFARDFGGSWTLTIPVEPPLPAGVKAGDKLTWTTTFTRAAPNAVTVSASGEVGGKKVVSITGLAGFDPKSRTIKLDWHRTDGTTGTVNYTRQGRGWTTRWYSVEADGTEETSASEVSIPDARSQVSRVTHRVRGGKKLPDMTLTMYRGLTPPGSPSPNRAVPPEVLKQLEFFAGDWAYEGKELKTKEPVRGLVSYRWSPDRYCLTWEQSWIDKDVLSFGMGLLGWDPSTGQLVETDFYEAGTTGHHRYRPTPQGWETESVYISPQGEVTRGRMFVTKRGPAEFEFRNPDFLGPLGKVFPGHGLVFRKLKPLTEQDFLDYGNAVAGEWQTEEVLVTDLPGVGKKGDKVVSRSAMAWGPGRKSLVITFDFPDRKARVLATWDPVEKRIVGLGSDAAGVVYRGTTTREGDRWVLRTSATGPDGKVRRATDTTTVQDGGNTQVHEVTDIFLDGVRQPDYRAVSKRVPK